MSFKVYIPARYQSSRLPGKLLLKTLGKTVLEYVVENANRSGADDVVVATDDKRIADVALSLGATTILTDIAHTSGTDRIAEAARINNEPAHQLIVNVQADEPLLPPTVIAQTVELLNSSPRAEMATVCEEFSTPEEIKDANVCKVVRDDNLRALYFSRAAIPHCRDVQDMASLAQVCRRHVGIYAYRVEFLQKFVALPPSPLEHLEKLEQLRALGNGYEIIVGDALADCGIGIDTRADFDRFCDRMNAS